MEMQPSSFPEHRIHHLLRRAEHDVYRAYAESPAQGIAVYGAVPPGGREVDFAIWYPNHVRVALEVKGGEYAFVNGSWRLLGPGGPEAVGCPITQAFDAGIKLHKYLKSNPGPHSPYVVSVAAFPDMEPGHDLERVNGLAAVVCGLDDIVTRVMEQALEHHDIMYPPTWEDARRESKLLLPDIPAQPDDGAPAGSTGMDAESAADLLGAHGITVGHVEHLHVHLPGA